MNKISLDTLGRKLGEKRGERGIRETAKEIGISPATLSRIERGHLPDLQTFKKACDWLGVDPGAVLGSKTVVPQQGKPQLAVHFKKAATVSPDTAQALAQLVLAAQRAMSLTQSQGNPDHV